MGEYILIGLGVIFFGIPFIIQVITWIVKPTTITEEETALRKREYEKAKRRSDGCSQLIILILGIILLLIAILR